MALLAACNSDESNSTVKQNESTFNENQDNHSEHKHNDAPNAEHIDHSTAIPSETSKTVSSIILDRYADYSLLGDKLGTTDPIEATNLNKTEYYKGVKYVGKVKYLMPDRNENVIGAFVEVGGNDDYSLVYVDFTKKNANEYNPTNNISKIDLTDKYIYFEGKIDGFQTHYQDNEALLVPSIDLSHIQVGEFPVISLDLTNHYGGPQVGGARDTLFYVTEGNSGDFIGVQILDEDWEEYTLNQPTNYPSVIKVSEFDSLETKQHHIIYSVVE